MEFKREIKSVKKELTIIGIINLEIDFNDFAEDFLNLFKKNKKLLLNILYEFDNQLFSYSLCTDTSYAEPRISFTDLKFKRDLIFSLKDSILNLGGCFSEKEIDTITQKIKKRESISKDVESKYKKSKQISDRINILQTHLPISLNVMKFDDKIYFLSTLDRIGAIKDYKEFSENDSWFSQVKGYIENYLDKSKTGKYSAKHGTEIIELYDQNKVPRGIFPRNCFYDTDYHQFVIWDFIFDRQGNMLIHKRKDNAKDNREMWDKSVGGHVDWDKELSSEKTAVREMIEELFEDELNKETMSHFTESEKNIIYLGEWRPKKRKGLPLEEVKNFKGTEWVYFKIPEQLKINTPRHFPDGSIKRLRVIVDSYIFIANQTLSPENLKALGLKNSPFRLMPLSQLKNETDLGKYINDKGEEEEFIPTPDLEYIMTGSFRDMLEEVSQYIKYTLQSKKV